MCDLSRLETGIEWRDVSAEAKDFVRGLVCVDPRKRLTVGQAKRHRWLSRHTRELEEVYGRAVEDWVKREKVDEGKNVALEHFSLSQSPHSLPAENIYSVSSSSAHSSSPSINTNPYPMGMFSFEPGSSLPSHLGEEREQQEGGENSNMSGVPSLLFDQLTSEPLREEGGSWCTSELYAAEEDELHNAAAGDGRLRSAIELAREVEARKSNIGVARVDGEGERWGDDKKRVRMGDKSKFFAER